MSGTCPNENAACWSAFAACRYTPNLSYLGVQIVSLLTSNKVMSNGRGTLVTRIVSSVRWRFDLPVPGKSKRVQRHGTERIRKQRADETGFLETQR